MNALALPAPAGADAASSHGRRWTLLAVALAVPVALPLLVIAGGWLQHDPATWAHLLDTVLAELLLNTAFLLLSVGTAVTVLGAGLAWLSAACEFPGRRHFDWLLMLPLALPAYVLAFVAIDLLDFAGPVQSTLRAWFGPGRWLPPIRSRGGIVLVMSLALYPYVYLLARSAFLAQGARALEAARSLGCGPWRAFLRAAVPVARPAIIAGTTLALMETLADFGTVAVFNFDTFTTAIYKTWFGLFSLPAATQLASLLLLSVVLALGAERALRGRARYAAAGRAQGGERIVLRGVRGWLASGLCSGVLALGFVLPLSRLLYWALERGLADLDARYLERLLNTLGLGALAALLTVGAALLLALAVRRQPSLTVRLAVRLATLGYALPGSVLAVGLMITLTWVDRRLGELGDWLGLPLDAVLRGSVWALLIAYGVRFTAAAWGPVDAACERVRPSLIEAARGLGVHGSGLLRRVYLPLLRPGLLAAALLVLVDVVKEMPATLLLRPFGFDTLAIRIYEMTAEGDWAGAALPALTLVLAGLLPVILLVCRSAASPH
ncbi:ABC transporter permease [Plasticicumulans acidivorans]|uniref:Iron(III) transport system permease protein n=1 Tax=Plasticicumulans acidivorans TaxID=886464 RepID=A0A317N552_9GAMM|nr:iron ABC transporter permease [Plasticicumulans acidivorans]PWV65869.1 iron(III) transport system permease protein [Plasticicumulans acidivorans]